MGLEGLSEVLTNLVRSIYGETISNHEKNIWPGGNNHFRCHYFLLVILGNYGVFPRRMAFGFSWQQPRSLFHTVPFTRGCVYRSVSPRDEI